MSTSGNNSNPLSVALDGLNAISSKVVGYDVSAGRPSGSGALHAADEFLGGITGRNSQRAAQNQAGDAINAAKANADLLLEQENEKKRVQDVQASSGAAGIRATAAAASSSAFASSSTPLSFGSQQKLGSDTQSFLGI